MVERIKNYLFILFLFIRRILLWRSAIGFNGDVVSLDYILKTLEAKNYFIPGVSANEGVSVTANGESAYYYKRGASTVTTGALGAQLSFTSSGVERKTIDMTNAIQIKAVIPYANYKTVSVDVVGDKVVQESITAQNLFNEIGIGEVEAYEAYDASLTTPLALHKDIVTDYNYQRGTSNVSAVAGVLFQAKKDFIQKNKARNLKPTAIFMGSALVADMKTANLLAYKEFTPGQSEALIGYFDGMAVIEVPDLSSTYEAILVHSDALGSPQNVNTLVLADGTAAGYPNGTIIAGEIGYGFEVCDPELIEFITA